jgi:DNA-nicking Smr family endonuclease
LSEHLQRANTKSGSKPAPKINSLAGLGEIKRVIEEKKSQLLALEQERLRLERKRIAEQELFKRAIGDVQPIQSKPRVTLQTDPTPPHATQQIKDDQNALRESLSDDFDVSTLLDTDDALSFRRAGIGVDVTKKLRKGEWSIQAHLDLHGLRRDEARAQLSIFLKDCLKSGYRCVRIIHGKGLGSPGKTPILKAKVQTWLVQKEEILAFVQAKPTQGGDGALLVLLKPNYKTK